MFIQVYDVLGVKVKIADARWNKVRHTYELTLTPGTIIRPVDDTTIAAAIPDIHYEFIPLRDISKHTAESFIGKKFFSFSSEYSFIEKKM